MCPDCISVIAVAVVVATPARVVKALLARAAEHFAMPGSTEYYPNNAPEGRLAWRIVSRPQGIAGVGRAVNASTR
jgi:hypothetical protein